MLLSPDKRYLKLSVASLIMLSVTLLAWSYRPINDEREVSALGADFSFQHTLINHAVAGSQNVRAVHPSLAHMDAWISAVGAAVAINDLDGDGLPNDICLVDPRTDSVTILPARLSSDRYSAFRLIPDHSVMPSAPMGCLPGDFDQDGNMDVLVYYWGRSPVIFYRRADRKSQSFGPGSFTSKELVPTPERWYSNAALIADLDGDGRPDILIANYFADGAEILDGNSNHPQRLNASMSHAYNGGGKHIFLSHPLSPRANSEFEEITPEILKDDGDTESPEETARILHGWTLAVGAADLNHDLLPEIYLANDFGPDRLLENLSTPGKVRFKLITGRRDFSTPKSKVLGRDSFKGMGVDFVDLNATGRMDILVSSITEEFGLEESNFAFINSCAPTENLDISGCLHDESETLGLSRSGWAWDIKAADFNNSGYSQIVQATGFIKAAIGSAAPGRWPELHETAMGNDLSVRFPALWHDYHSNDDISGHDLNRFYARETNGHFIDISKAVGLRHDAVARGIAIADIDGDGLLDFAVANQWGDSDFYYNTDSHAGRALSLRLLLPHDLSSQFQVASMGVAHQAVYAMTAEAIVSLPSGKQIRQQVNGGNGHSGRGSFDLHFGLGRVDDGVALPVELRWRDLHGKLQSRRVLLKPGRYNMVLGA